MSQPTLFLLVFLYSALLWVVVLGIYSTFVESLDFGRLSHFALQSAILIGVVAAVVTFVPGGNFLTLLVWGLGLIVIMRLEFWTASKVLLILWAVNLLAWLVLYWLDLSARDTTSP